MDYEKKYKEALERARNIRFGNTNSALANVVCEEIFPEIRESEDEMIRKEMISIFSKFEESYTLYGDKYDYKKWVAWLEKQGDQKPTWSDDDEKMMQLIHKYVKASASNFDYENIQIWFRNIKNRVQHHWKPTDERKEENRL